MGLKYMTPPTPVDLRFNKTTTAARPEGLETIFEERGSIHVSSAHTTNDGQPVAAVEPMNYDAVSAMFERHSSL